MGKFETLLTAAVLATGCVEKEQPTSLPESAQAQAATTMSQKGIARMCTEEGQAAKAVYLERFDGHENSTILAAAEIAGEDARQACVEKNGRILPPNDQEVIPPQIASSREVCRSRLRQASEDLDKIRGTLSGGPNSFDRGPDEEWRNCLKEQGLPGNTPKE